MKFIDNKFSLVWQKRLMVIAITLMMVIYVPAYIVRHENSDIWNSAEEQMCNPGQTLIAVRQPDKGNNWIIDNFRNRYVNSSFNFGFYSSYMGFDANDINMRCAAKLFNKSKMLFLPDDVVQRISSDSTAFCHYELDKHQDLYIWQMKDDRPVSRVTFLLNPEDRSQLNMLQRMVAYDGDSYELDPFKHEVVQVGGRNYLVFTRPTTNIYRRIRDIKIDYEEN